MGGRTKLVVSVFMAFCLTITQLELGAFAQTVAQPVAPEPDASKGVAIEAPAATQMVAVQTPSEPATQQSPAPPANQTNPPPSRHTWRWILIGVAATALTVGTIILLHNPKTEPVITVGAPTIGSPQ